MEFLGREHYFKTEMRFNNFTNVANIGFKGTISSRSEQTFKQGIETLS